jgi:hypothetical protein
MQKSYYQHVELVPLGTEAIRHLLRDLVGGDPALGDLTAANERKTSSPTSSTRPARLRHTSRVAGVGLPAR